MGLQIEKKVFEPIPGSKWVAFLGKTLAVPLSTRGMYKRVLVNGMLRGTLR